MIHQDLMFRFQIVQAVLSYFIIKIGTGYKHYIHRCIRRIDTANVLRRDNFNVGTQPERGGKLNKPASNRYIQVGMLLSILVQPLYSLAITNRPIIGGFACFENIPSFGYSAKKFVKINILVRVIINIDLNNIQKNKPKNNRMRQYFYVLIGSNDPLHQFGSTDSSNHRCCRNEF